MCMNRQRVRGFTLIELILFIVVVAVALAGILQVMNVTVAASANPMVRKQAVALAESILEEILQKEFSDPDGVNGETTRATFDDVADYNGKTQAIFTDWPAGLSAYQVAIVVTDTTLGGAPGVAVKKVSVTVSGGSNVITMTGYRSNY